MRRRFRCCIAKERRHHKEPSGPCCGVVELRRCRLRGVCPLAPPAKSKFGDVTMLWGELTGLRSRHRVTGAAVESGVTNVGYMTIRFLSLRGCQRLQRCWASVDGGVIALQRGPRIQV
ncbi:hypothetical protein NDU88_006837 [Pleurodeles waltl]|uniref:Uncharacterized protein n=1 Tax=Pleurodeles waltl TaxID=8319 RepID=A0AAV7WBW7_PLEWA|nr:hypothetical protein NDU88_006837 [Pleurodeles waltl]